MVRQSTYFLVTLLCLGVICPNVYGQTGELDSLRASLSSELSDSSRVEVLKDMADIYYDYDLDSTIFYYNEVISQAKQVPYYNLEFSAWRSLGYVYSNRKNDFEEALEFFNTAVERSTAESDTIGMAYVLSDIGRIYWKQGKSYEALEQHLKVRDLGNQLQSARVMLRANTSLGILENENGNNSKAKEYYQEALSIANELKRNRSRGLLMNNLGVAYQDDEAYDVALDYFQQSDSIFTGLEDNGWLSLVNYNVGQNYLLQKYPKKGKEYFLTALSFNEKVDNKEREVMILSGLAMAYQQLDKFSSSIRSAEKALAILEDLDTDLYYDDLYNTLGESYELSGNHKKAATYYKKHIDFRDKNDEVTATKKIASLWHLYDSKKQENKILELKAINLEKDVALKTSNANLRGWTFAFFSLLLCSLLAYYFVKLRQFKRYNKLKNKLANDLHDNLGASLNRVKMLSSRLNNGRYEDSQKSEIITKIKNISNDLMYSMHDMVWSLDKKKESIGNLLERIQDHADVALGDFNIPYRFKIELSNQGEILKTKEKVNTYLIFKESLTNILKHTEAEKVVISISEQDATHFKMSISSFYERRKSTEKLSTHMGLKNMKARARELGGLLNVIDKPNNFIVQFTF